MEGYLRQATEEDMDLLFEWTNDSTVRRNSFRIEAIPYEEHKQWYRQLLSAEDRRQYIYEYNKEAIGQVRIDIHGESAEISYSICAAKRGVGHGEVLLQLLYNQVKKDFPEVKKLVGKVKPENIASQRAFLAVGYQESFQTFELPIGEGEPAIPAIKSGGGGGYSI